MGPLKGVKIVEFAALGPAPFCSMLLADLGAEVIRIDRRPSQDAHVLFDPQVDILNRGRPPLYLNLKQSEGLAAAQKLIERADILIEGFRPGVMERLGLGPDVCLRQNPRLVYGRMTGWGQHGPLAQAAGHDITYVALAGALNSFRARDGEPVPPLNLVGDLGGGSMFLAVGVLSALLEARQSGKGQVVDAAMTDGVAVLMAMAYTLKAMGELTNEQGKSWVDGGAHFYTTYRCADDKWIAVGPLEPQFYELFLRKCGIDDPAFKAQWDRSRWPDLKQRLAQIFLTKTRAEWCALLEGTDACFAPVLDMDEVTKHPHHQARETFIEVDGIVQPAPAPRFSRTPSEVKRTAAQAKGDIDAMLKSWGYTTADIEQLRRFGDV